MWCDMPMQVPAYLIEAEAEVEAKARLSPQHQFSPYLHAGRVCWWDSVVGVAGESGAGLTKEGFLTRPVRQVVRIAQIA